MLKSFKKTNFALLSIILILTLGSCSSLGTPQKVNLALDLEAGQDYQLTSHVKNDYTQSLQGIPISFTNEIKMVNTYHVSEVDSDGNMKIDVRYDAFDYTMDFDYPDVTAEDNASLDEEIYRNLRNASDSVKKLNFGLTINPKGEILQFDGLKEAIQHIINLQESVDSEATTIGIEQIMSEDIFSDSWNQTFDYIPAEPVGVGDSWNSNLSITDQISMTVAYTYTVTDISSKTVTLAYTGQILSGGIGNNALLNLDVEGVDAQIDIEGNIEGTMEVDRSTGWINRQDSTVHVGGSIDVTAYGLTINMPIDMNIIASVD
ncbi:DUF6263 family protein [Spirochaeta cellobiosiphila]|uniref:DUF6263 family protein n=1 Tax=Spirochaeta cellobiosiphila TaxID=504483 RepID=UPI00041AE01C|nr:DUF6263 family protein [Spirochaeta cellobiosiphila]